MIGFRIKGTPCLKRKPCSTYGKQILIGQRAVVCNQCDMICHVKCAKTNRFLPLRENTFCPMCLSSHDIIKYTPFNEIVNSDSQESDKFYETEPSEYLKNLQELSNILENCKAICEAESGF